MFSSDNSSVDRITSGYCSNSHKRKPGYSEIMRGEQVPKSDSACSIQTFGWRVRIYADRAISLMPVEDDRSTYFLNWLAENSFAIGAYAFNKGNTEHRVFPESCVSDLDAEIDRMKTWIKTTTGRNATDFIRTKSEYGLQIEELQVQIRELEAGYVGWLYDSRVVSDFYSHLRKDPEGGLLRFNRMMVLGDFLNRVSCFLFWLNQMHDVMRVMAVGDELTFIERKPEHVDIQEWKSQQMTLPPMFPVA